jgi:hypothetical protein
VSVGGHRVPTSQANGPLPDAFENSDFRPTVAFVQLFPRIAGVFSWLQSHPSFTVTSVSGNATTSGERDAGDDLDGDEAARLLDVPLEVLLSWARRMEFPRDLGAPGAPRFPRREVEALRDALPTAHSVEGAVRAAQERLGGG